MDITFEEFNRAAFTLYGGNPVLRRHGASPLVADPSVLTPAESGDGLWHLACHTIFGIELYTSADGYSWELSGRPVRRAMRADLKYIGGTYYLYYEHLFPFVKKLVTTFFGGWHSDIYLTKSADLRHWTKPQRVLSNAMPYAADSRGRAASNPFLLLEDGGKCSLYFSAGQTYLNDCGFCEPTVISRADAASPDGPFTALPEALLSPAPDERWRNLCCGCIKVYRLKDAYIGIQNGIYRAEDGTSRSAIVLLRSSDGKTFRYVKDLLTPRECPDAKDPYWMKQFVYASSLTLYDGKLRLYFNARNRADVLRGRENIGLYTADL